MSLHIVKRCTYLSGRFLDYQQDFLILREVENNKMNFSEYQASNELQRVASEVGFYLDSIETLLWLYENLSCKEDMAMVRRHTKLKVSCYAKQVDLLIRAVNLNLGHTNVAGMATMAVRIKDDLRDVKTAFESLAKELQEESPENSPKTDPLSEKGSEPRSNASLLPGLAEIGGIKTRFIVLTPGQSRERGQ